MKLRPFGRRAFTRGSRQYTAALFARFARNALARFGLDEVTSDGTPTREPEQIRLMRNARKAERHQAAGINAPLKRYLRNRYGEAA